MIYKFECLMGSNDAMEVKSVDGDCYESTENKLIQFSIENESIGTAYFVLTKDDVYKLIGALHLLHKEMK